MIRIVLYAILFFILYRLFFGGPRLSGENSTRIRRDESGTNSPGDRPINRDQGRRRAADEEGEYVDYEEVD